MNDRSDIRIEICVESAEGALAAQQGGAGRVELCSSLLEGGLTPSAGLIAEVRRQIDIDLMVMLRPRGGDFHYSDPELAVMQRDLALAKQLGANGVVLGLLTLDGEVDRLRLVQLLQIARPLAVTFHRAFDMAADPLLALETLIDLGVERLLTSGQQATALAGADSIAQLVQRADGRIAIMAGGGITVQNVRTVVEQSGVREVHLSARSTVDSPMRYRNQHLSMGGSTLPSEYERRITDVALVRAVRGALTIDGRR